MRFIKIFLLTIALLVTMTMNAVALPLDDQAEIIITSVLTSDNTHKVHPGAYLIDDKLDTYWAVNQNSAFGWVELILSEPALIHGLELNANLGMGNNLTVLYQQQNGQWAAFLGGKINSIPDNGIIDLSYDRIVTGRIRLLIQGNNLDQARFNEIKLKSQPAKEIFHRISPQSVEASGHTSYLTREHFLTDGNTYTAWMVKPRYRSGQNWLFETIENYLGIPINYNYDYNWSDRPSYYNYGEVLFDFDQIQTLANLNIYFTEQTRGDLTVESKINGDWQKIGFIPERKQAGWYRLPLDNIRASKIRFTMEANGHEAVGGISEIEFWGYGAYTGFQQQELGPQTAQLNTAVNREFKLVKEKSNNYWLDFAVESAAGERLNLELNGGEYWAQKICNINGHTIFSLSLTEEMLSDDVNYLRIKPQEGILTGLKLIHKGDGVQYFYNSILNDGLVLTSSDDSVEQFINFTQKTAVEQIEIYTSQGGEVFLSYKNGTSWITVVPTAITPGLIRFNTPFTTDQIKLTNSSLIPINEVRVLGSVVTDQAPIVRLLRPEDYEVFDCDQLSDKYLVGFVDNPQAKVKVNGKDVFQVGHYFGCHLTAIGINTWEDTVVEAIAADAEGRSGRDETHIIIDKLPWVTLDQAETTVITDNLSYQISGELKKANCVVRINGQPVIGQIGKFNAQIPLVEGLNLIKIQCVYTKPDSESFTQTLLRKVVRDKNELLLQVTEPLGNIRINAASINVTGKVYGSGPLKVWVNGQAAVVDGEYFQLPVSLIEGENSITVKAKNGRGKETQAVFTVWRDTKAPLLTITQPIDQMVTNSAAVTISGTVTDNSPIFVLVNGTLVELSANKFSTVVNLPEDWNQINIIAQDGAGNMTKKTIRVQVDSQAPLEFTPSVDPSGWTNNNRPEISFVTTDATTGVDHYEIRIGDGTWSAPVVSPYQFSVAFSDGEHTVQVKAVDKAGNERIGEVKVYIDTTPPAVPANFRVIPGNGKIILKWDVPSEDTVEYKVERQPVGEPVVASVNENVFVDPDLQNGAIFEYRIWAVDRALNESQSTVWKKGMVGLAVAEYVPDEGSIVEYDGVTLVMPNIGFSEDVTKIEVTEVTSQHLDEKAVYPIIGPIYEFSAYQEGENTPLENCVMEEGYLGRIQYDPDLVPEGFPEQNLGVYYYEPMFDRWFLVDVAGVDTRDHIIYFMTNHFSSFSVQASLIQDLSPQEYKDSGYSPLKSYSKHSGLMVSPQGGTASTNVTEMVLPGRDGFDLVISRRYDTATARNDAFSLAINGRLGVNLTAPGGSGGYKILKNLDEIQKTVHTLQSAGDFIEENILNILEQYLFNQGDYAYSMGQGWRLNLPYMKAANSALMLCTAEGAIYSINEMNIIGVPVSLPNYRKVTFKQQEGDDFTLTVEQVSAPLDIVGLITRSDQVFKSRWYSTGYELRVKDGTIYKLDALGRTTKITDPSGKNTIDVEYDGLFLDYITDTMGRRVKFDYHGTLMWPKIDKIWVENDIYHREINYSIGSDALLDSARDVGGRTAYYEYDSRLLVAGEAGFKVNFMTMIVKIVGGPFTALAGSIFGTADIELYGRFQAQIVYPMDELVAPGQGRVTISYDQPTFMYGNVKIDYFKLLFIKVPVSATFSINMEQRLLADRVNVYLDSGGPLVKSTRFSYDYNERTHGQPYVTKTIENDGKKQTVYKYQAFAKERRRWEMKSVPIGEFPEDTSSPFQVWFPFSVYSIEMVTVNTATEIRNSQTNSLLELNETKYNPNTMRPTVQTVRHGSNYRTISYSYDNWGNVTYTHDYSISNGRTNQTKNWIYYLQTNSTPSSDAPWLGSPFAQMDLSRRRNNLPIGRIVANYTPTTSGGETITYLHSYYQYNDIGQQISNAQWDGSEWLLSQYEYHPTFGSITKMINPEGHEKLFEYDTHGLPSAITEKSVLNAARETEDLITRTGYEYMSGWKVWEQNPRGYVTQYTYDILGRTTQIKAPDDDDQKGWIPSGSQPSFRNNNPVTSIEYNDRDLYSIVNDPLGNRTMYDFDELGRMVKLVKYQRSAGQYQEVAVTNLQYDGWGNIIAITDPNRNTTNYSYDAMDRNTAITYPGGAAKTMSFNYDTNILTILDENNHKTVEEHDMQGRVLKQTRYIKYDTIETKTYYDGLGNLVISEGPKSGVITVNTYNQLNLLDRTDLPQEKFRENGVEVSVTPYQRFTYNKVGLKIADIVSAPEGERITDYEIDGLGRVYRTTVRYTDNSEVKEAVTETYYDGSGNKIKVVDANNTSLPKNQQKYFEYKYTAADLLEYEIDPAGNKTSYTYDKAGNRKSMTDPRGNSGKYSGDFTIIYDYDDLNRLVTGHLPALPGQAQKSEVHLKYDARGNLLERIEPNGMITSYTYWPRNWVKSVTVSGDNTNYTTNHFYDEVGNETLIQDARSNTTMKEYDDLNRLVKITYPETEGQVVEQFEYDKNNNRTAFINGRFFKTNYTYDNYNRLIQVEAGSDHITKYSYDRFGNITQMENALGHVTIYNYDELNRLLIETDPQQYQKHYSYDAVGNRVWSRDPNGTTSEYQYYPNNLVKQITLKKGDQTQILNYDYDEAGYRTKVSNGAVVTSYNIFNGSYRPDAFGRIYKESKTFDGQTSSVEYQYDVMGQVTGVKYPTGNWVNYEYNSLGQLVKVPGYVEEKPLYDQGGLLVGLKAANNINTAYTYDKNGRLKNLSYANQDVKFKEYSYTYDGANNILSKNEDLFDYDRLNQLIYANLKGNFETDPEEDVLEVGLSRDDFQNQKPLEFSLDEVELIELDYAAGSIGVDLLEPFPVSKVTLTPKSPVHRVQGRNLLVYISENNSNYAKVDDWQVVVGEKGVLEIVFDTPVNTRYIKIKCFYDNRTDELIPVNLATFINEPEEIIRVHYLVTSRQEQYSYDAIGNRDTETITQRYPVTRNYEYYQNSSRLKSNGKYGFEYDSNGNLVKKLEINGNTVWNYEYDLMNRLVSVKKNGVDVAGYIYDESGLRLKKQGKDKAVYYVFDIGGNVLYEQENRNYLEYVYVLGKHFARVDGDLDNSTVKKYFYHTDHLGSTVLVTDEEGQTVWASEYTPFGGKHSTEGKLSRAAKFTGKDLDEDIGLYYFNARWYDEELGRFVSEDLMNDSNSPNLYTYGANNPLRFTDPTGYWNEDSVWWNPFSWGNFTQTESVTAIDEETETSTTVTIKTKAGVFGVYSEEIYVDDLLLEAYELLNEIRFVIIQNDTQAGSPDANKKTHYDKDKKKPLTWCNRAAERILREMGYDTTILFVRYDPKTQEAFSRFSNKGVIDSTGGWTNANWIAKNAAEAAERKLIKEVTPEEAQKLANRGIPVLAAQDRYPKIGHVGIVAPTNKPYDSTKGPLIGQAGTINRFDYALDSFKSNYSVHYYVLNKKELEGGL